MTIEHRKSAIVSELLQGNLNNLVHSLAVALQERDEALAKAADLEAKLNPKLDTTPTGEKPA